MDYQAIADKIVMMIVLSKSEPDVLSKNVEDKLRQVAHAEYLRGVKDTMQMKKEI